MASKTIQFRATEADQKLIAQLRKKLRNQPVATVIRRGLEALAVSLGLLMLFGCGGGSLTPVPAKIQSTISQNQFFNSSMVGQVWIFQNADATCVTTIHVNAAPDSNYYPAGSIVLNITKNKPECYWAYGTESASVDFLLSPMSDASYRSMGWVAYFPTVLPSWAPSHIYASQVQAPTGAPTPYLIVPPPSLTVSNPMVTETSYNRWDFNGQNFNSFVSGPPVANVYWKTSFYMQNGNAISEQWEGVCGHEIWTFAANRGIVAIEFPNDGSPTCTPLPPSTKIFRE
jgi:hypothetical protein